MAAKRPHLPAPGRRGAFTVEFAMALLLFLAFMGGIFELARAVYLWNTAQEVTRRAARAAALSNFADPARIAALRAAAAFDGSAGALSLAAPLSAAHVRIDYLSLGANGTLVPVTALPNCPARNLLNCLADPNGGSCIRFVRARLCQPGPAASCQAVPYHSVMPLVDAMFASAGVPISLPRAASVVRAETLGYRPGMGLCP